MLPLGGAVIAGEAVAYPKNKLTITPTTPSIVIRGTRPTFLLTTLGDDSNRLFILYGNKIAAIETTMKTMNKFSVAYT
jgi:hypothetical protein